MHRTTRLLAGLLIVGLTVGASDAHRGWRHDGDGRFPGGNLPETWDSSTVLWKTELPDWSNASPVVGAERIFVCAEPASLLCLDRESGKVLWKRSIRYYDLLPPGEREQAREATRKRDELNKEKNQLRRRLRKLTRQQKKNPEDDSIAEKAKPIRKELSRVRSAMKELEPLTRPAAHKTNGYTSPTPVTDGASVYVVFGTGVVASFDMEGKRQWARVLEKPRHQWGHSSSPILAGGRLIVLVQNVYGLDPETGETVWQVKSKPHWGSPARVICGRQEAVVTPNGELIRARDGFVVAHRMAELTYNAPVIKDGIAYFIQHGGRAVRLPPACDKRARPEVLWRTKPYKNRYYSSPVVHKGLIYAVTRNGRFSVIDAQDGAVVYEKQLDWGKGNAYASIVLAGDELLVSNDNGKAIVVRPGRKFVKIRDIDGDPYRTTPVCLGNRMYVRTLKALVCLNTGHE